MHTQIWTPSSSNVGLLLHRQYHQKCEPMILKMCLKSEFVLWQPRYYKLLTEKKDKKTNVFWNTHIFENVLLLLIRRNYL